MMMQMLLAGGASVLRDHHRAGDADNPRGYFELEAVKHTQRDAAWVKDAPGKAVKVIHHLLAFLPAGPSYRVIMMRRPIGEVLRSQRVMLDRSGKPGGAVPPDTLAKVFTAQLQKTEALLAQRADMASLDVAYADVVNDPLVQARRVAAFLGDDTLDAEAMAGAVDPALYRQRG